MSPPKTSELWPKTPRLRGLRGAGKLLRRPGKDAQAKANDFKAQYDAIHKAKGKRTGLDTAVIATQATFMKHSSEHYDEGGKAGH